MAYKKSILKISLYVANSLLFAMVIFTANAQSNTASSKKPNIVFLLADDLGYGELGSYGQQQIKTPFLDALAAKGMSFTNFYAGNALCAPSRAVLMTGIHSGHSSVRGNTGFYTDRNQLDRVSIKPTEITVAEMLKPAGYETIFFGKWHLDDPYYLETWAANRGFDYAVQGQWSRLNGDFKIDPDMDWVNGLMDSKRYDYDKYSCMDEFRTTQAIDFFEKRSSEKPFFLFMSYRVPHAHEIHIRNKNMYKSMNWPELERLHATRITLLDEQVGRLIRYLESNGQLENTLIIFSSDNGGHVENGHDKDFFSSNGVLRGQKRDLYEGGIRVPFFAVWANKIKANSTSTHVAAFQDMMPTIAEVAGIDVPKQTDGISLLPTLLGKSQQSIHPYLYWGLHLNQKPKDGNDLGFRQAIRQDKWKAVRYGVKNVTELYDLSKDPRESNNIAIKFPEKVLEFEALFKQSSKPTEHFKYGGNFGF
ncbi:sulfatase-like hydrolase/transferase [Mariniflexile sp. AS56]|uniref:sulfatase-like hydrolase/transferase n=1 Tax=Mariniflexile sp. AS56 TaxID=3063957 RepID=UPI0026EA4B01|nr:sulfatase-like hydrolase/transferase [Mariniflexile sp. AS56]MDO7173115.1 sulfatase-like hydrolase/transferase [Mariniflexile sp. AS56]